MNELTLHTLETQFSSLGNLSPGWMDGEGLAINKLKLGKLKRLLTKACEEGLTVPYLYPTLQGHVQAEWSFTNHEVSAYFNFDMDTIECLSVHVFTNAFKSKSFDLDELGMVYTSLFVQEHV